jgi:hypothetical protein
MEQLAIDTGSILRDVGMARTLDAEPETWIEGALAALAVFASLPEWSTFKTEDFRAWYLDQGYPQPHDAHVWGALTNRASRDRVIRFTGSYAPTVSPRTHAHPVKVWTAA